MNEIAESPQESPIQELRKKAEEKYEGTTEPLAKKTQIEWSIFCGLESHQITQELTVNWIKTEEAYYKERANQELASNDVDINTVHYFETWEKHHDALLGATGKGPVSKTIEVLRDSAKSWEDMATKNRIKLNEGGPFGENIAFSITTAQNQIPRWEKISSNLNTAARLFENEPKLTVAEKPVEQPVQ